MPWQLRHQGSPQALTNLSLQQVAEGLRDGLWETTDEAMGPSDKTWRQIEQHPALAEIVEEVEAPPPVIYDEGTSLDMNALIDVCLVLLIFFILTTTYAAAVQKVVPLPSWEEKSKKPRSVTPKEANRMIRVKASLHSDGHPVIRVENVEVSALAADGKSLDVDKLREALVPHVRTGPEPKNQMLLDARQISWGTVIAIQDAAKAAQIIKINYVASE